jgi:hypothetical protein
VFAARVRVTRVAGRRRAAHAGGIWRCSCRHRARSASDPAVAFGHHESQSETRCAECRSGHHPRPRHPLRRPCGHRGGAAASGAAPTRRSARSGPSAGHVTRLRKTRSEVLAGRTLAPRAWHKRQVRARVSGSGCVCLCRFSRCRCCVCGSGASTQRPPVPVVGEAEGSSASRASPSFDRAAGLEGVPARVPGIGTRWPAATT